MVLVFTKEATKFVIGKYDSDGTISFEGTIGESSRSAIKNTLRILSQQDQKIKQVIQLSLNSLSNPIIIIDNSGESTLNFLVIMNRIFENSKAQESVVFKLRELLIEHDDSLLEEPLKYLQELEALFLERKAEDFKEFMPLLLNYFLTDIETNPQKMQDFIENAEVNGAQSSFYSDITEILLNQDLSGTINFQGRIDILENKLSDAESEEKGRFWFNLALLSLRMKKLDLFEYLLNNLLLKRTDIIKDFALSLSVFGYFLGKTELAYRYLTEINPNFISHLSTKAAISFSRIKGAVFEKMKDYYSALENYNTAVALLSNLEQITGDVALAYAGIGNIRSISGQYNQAITAYSFASSLFNFLSLNEQQLSMNHNVFTIRTLKAKNYLSAGIVSLNNEDFARSQEYLENAIMEFSLLLLESPEDRIKIVAKDVLSLLNPLLLRSTIDQTIEIKLNEIKTNIDELIDTSKKLIQNETRTEAIIQTLKNLSTPRTTIVYQVSLIYQDGRFITSERSEENVFPQDKEMIFAGAITAIQMLIKETLQSDDIRTIDTGDTQLILRKSNLIQIIVVANKVSEDIIRYTDDLITKIEKDYKDILTEWDGSLEKIRDTSTLMKELLIDKINKKN